MKKALIIACYIGKLPSCINLWFKSCSYNQDYDFMLVTDDDINVNVPENVIIFHQTLKNLKERFQQCLGFEILLETPYKLCDYKPLYGSAFKDILCNYEFWGHCDIDLVFGRISDFYTDEILNNYDRIGSFGHLILYRNNSEINNLYKKKGGPFSYRKVFSSKYNYGFDERYGYNMLCKYNNVRWYDCGHKYCLDKWRTPPLYFGEIKNYSKQAVLYRNGLVYQVYIDENNNFYMKEKIYYHFSNTNYDFSKTNDDFENLLFTYDQCFKLNRGVERYLKCLEEEKTTPQFWKKRWEDFKKRSLIQKYIYLKQKFYYFILRR